MPVSRRLREDASESSVREEKGGGRAGVRLARAGGLTGPVLFGMILDHTGNGQTAGSWGWAFATTGLVILAGAVAVRLLSWRSAP